MKIRKLEFTEKKRNEWEAETPIGRYFIDLSEEYESYSDLQEIGIDKTFEEAVERVKNYHETIIKKCLI